MPIVNLNEMIKHAYQNDYAIGCFKIINLDFLKGVIQAAEQTDSPIILSICESDFNYSDLEILMPSIEAVARKTLIPVAIQFTNCSSLDTAIKSINLGCNSIKLDTSLSLPANLSVSQDIVNMAHSCGVAVEAFFPEVEKNYVNENNDNTLEEITDYVTKSKIDIIDVSIKSVLINSEENPTIDFSRLNQIKKRWIYLWQLKE